jgi:hypothetical protein
MRATRSKNKKAHPAAPIMTESEKTKAGIAPKRSRKLNQREQIRVLEARLAIANNPDESAVVSKEPLVGSVKLPHALI